MAWNFGNRRVVGERAPLPRAAPGDPATVLFKLFGLSAKGLVVINVSAGDIIDGPLGCP